MTPAARLLLFLLPLAMLASCGKPAGTESAPPQPPSPATPPPTPPPVPGSEVQHLLEGRRISGQAFQVLSSNLMHGLNEGVVSSALRFCSTQAIPITDSVATTNEVRLRRLSHKARNPENRVGEEEMVLLHEFQRSVVAGQTPAPLLRTNASGTVTYYAAIVLNNPLCLNCHGQPGTDIRSETLEVLRTLYPEDQAVGFKLGDLRGMWRIDFPPKANPATTR